MAQNNRVDFFRHPLKFFNALVNGAQNHHENIDNEELPSSNSLMLGKHNVSDMMALVASNAWYGGNPTKIDLFAGDNVITIEGYIYEPFYEDFSATSSISLNGKVLYGIDSRSVAAYRHETYQKGVFETADEAIAHVIDVTKGFEIVVDKDKNSSLEDKVNHYVEEKQFNSSTVKHEPFEIGLNGGSKVSEMNSSSNPQKDEETHFWRQRAAEELPNAEYYIEHFSEKQLQELVIANRTGHDISVFADPRQTPEQLRYIYKSAEAGEDVSYYIHNTSFNPAVLNNMKGKLFEQEIKEMVKAEKAQNNQGLSAVDDLIASADKKRTEQDQSILKNKEAEPER